MASICEVQGCDLVQYISGDNFRWPLCDYHAERWREKRPSTPLEYLSFKQAESEMLVHEHKALWMSWR